jgi:hypothetical protein
MVAGEHVVNAWLLLSTVDIDYGTLTLSFVRPCIDRHLHESVWLDHPACPPRGC